MLLNLSLRMQYYICSTCFWNPVHKSKVSQDWILLIGTHFRIPSCIQHKVCIYNLLLDIFEPPFISGSEGARHPHHLPVFVHHLDGDWSVLWPHWTAGVDTRIRKAHSMVIISEQWYAVLVVQIGLDQSRNIKSFSTPQHSSLFWMIPLQTILILILKHLIA